MKKIISIIPARGGSKRLPKKNIIKLGGKPMIAHVIKALLASGAVDKILVSSDSEEILQTAAKYGADTSRRPSELATDDANTIDVIRYELAKESAKEFDFVMINQPTSPLLSSETIRQAVQKMTENDYDALFSVIKVDVHPRYYWKINPTDRLEKFIQTDSLVSGEQLYRPNGAIYIYKKEFFLGSQDPYPFSDKKTGYIEMNKIESIDIDTADDLEIAKKFI